MIKKIEEYVIKNYPSRFKEGDKITIEEREKHYCIYLKDGSPVFINKRKFNE